jgi:hypothetical protein
MPDRSGAPRLALHAAELGFEHPITGKAMQFTMPLPRDLAMFLERLRKGGSRGQGTGVRDQGTGVRDPDAARKDSEKF